MLKILIIEDEPLVAKDLVNQLKSIEQEINILSIVNSVAHGLDWFSKNKLPDLIISDIQLSDGISFEIFEQLNIPCPVIFTTAYNEYAIRAFKVNSIDYLLKPISKQELSKAIEKYRQIKSGYNFELQEILQNWESNKQKKYKDRFLCVFKNALIPVEATDIAFFHKEELIYIHTFKADRYISEYNTMDEIEHLINPELFYRANRQYIVNIKAVGKVKTTQKGITANLISTFENEIDISREKAVDFKNWLVGEQL
jgi:two-component system, LytTR family, response regulator